MKHDAKLQAILDRIPDKLPTAEEIGQVIAIWIVEFNSGTAGASLLTRCQDRYNLMGLARLEPGDEWGLAAFEKLGTPPPKHRHNAEGVAIGIMRMRNLVFAKHKIHEFIKADYPGDQEYLNALAAAGFGDLPLFQRLVH